MSASPAVGDKIRITREGVVTSLTRDGKFYYQDTPERIPLLVRDNDTVEITEKITEKAYEPGAIYLITTGSMQGSVVKYHAASGGMPAGFGALHATFGFGSDAYRRDTANGDPVKLVREDAS
jgi:hypothetical protein